MIIEALNKLVEGETLTPEQAAKCIAAIAEGRVSPAQAAAFLTALRIRGETPEVLAAMAKVMLEKAIPVKVVGDVIDTCGTGGDVVKTVNASTLAALVVAASGGKVAKHGNRSFTGHTGSADLLEELGVRIDVEPSVVARCIESTGFGFIFAPRYHPSMSVVAGVRREMGIRTVFNMLGPLTNPARVSRQSLGVSSSQQLPLMVKTLQLLGVERAAVYHGLEGLDEVSASAPTEVAWLDENRVRMSTVKPEDFGIESVKTGELVVASRWESVQRAKKIIYCEVGRSDPDIRLVLCNASVALWVAGLADDLQYGVELAWEAISSGKVAKVLKHVVEETGGDTDRLQN